MAETLRQWLEPAEDPLVMGPFRTQADVERLDRVGEIMTQPKIVYGQHWLVWIALGTALTVSLRYLVFYLLTPVAGRYISDARELRRASKESSSTTASETDESRELEKAKKLLVKKWVKYVWHGSAYVAMIIWGIKLMLQAPWSVANTGSMHYVAKGFPHVSDSVTQPELLEEIYAFACLQLSWYFAGTVENIVHDRSRSDFLMMMLHHFLTITLIWGSMQAHAHRVAIHITVFLDISDIWMYGAKGIHLVTSDFNGNGRPGTFGVQLTALGSLAVVWGVTRVLIYGWIVAAMWVYNPFSELGFVGQYLEAFIALLWVLQAMWGAAICRMVFSMWRKGAFVDTVSGDYTTVNAKKES